MSATLPPLSPPDLDRIHRAAADLRSAVFRDAFLALWRALGRFAAPVTQRLAALRVADELGAMSDRALADIGLTRSDLSPQRLAAIGEDGTLARNERRPAPHRPANANEDLRAAA
jgi:uncharacterized protein YjiS (DUF1127 family)